MYACILNFHRSSTPHIIKNHYGYQKLAFQIFKFTSCLLCLLSRVWSSFPTMHIVSGPEWDSAKSPTQRIQQINCELLRNKARTRL